MYLLAIFLTNQSYESSCFLSLPQLIHYLVFSSHTRLWMEEKSLISQSALSCCGYCVQPLIRRYQCRMRACGCKPCRESKIASSEKMRIGGTAEMAWMQICDPSDKEKGHYSIEISDGVKTHTRTFDLSGQGKEGINTLSRLNVSNQCLYSVLFY